MLGFLILAITAGWAQDKKRPTDEQRGKELYDRHCLACHGATNRGDGPATGALVFPVPDLQGKVDAGKPGTDMVLYGSGPMPAYEATFDLEDAKRVLKYMAVVHTKPPPAPAKPAAAPPVGPKPAEPPAQLAR